MSYSVIGGIISANTALVLEFLPPRKGRVDGEYSGTEQVVENSEWQGDNQKPGNMSSEITKQSLPHAKKLKGTVKPSIGGRLNEFFSQDRDREDIEVTFIRANDFAYAPAGSRDFSGSIPLSADEVRNSPTDGAPKII